jgi:hypothetical protein
MPALGAAWLAYFIGDFKPTGGVGAQCLSGAKHAVLAAGSYW